MDHGILYSAWTEAHADICPVVRQAESLAGRYKRAGVSQQTLQGLLSAGRDLLRRCKEGPFAM